MSAAMTDPASVFEDDVATDESGGTITSVDRDEMLRAKQELERLRTPQNIHYGDARSCNIAMQNAVDDINKMIEGAADAPRTYNLTVALPDKHAAFQTAGLIQEIYQLIEANQDKLKDKVNFEVRPNVFPGEIESEKKADLMRAINYAVHHNRKGYALPVLSEDKTKQALSQLEELVELRAKAGQKITFELPDGYETDAEVAKIIADKIKYLAEKYPNTLKVKAGKANIEDPNSSFHRHFTKKKYQTQLTSGMSGEEINAAIDKLAKERKESLENGNKSRPRFSLHIGKGLKLLGQMKSKIVDLWNEHLRDARLEPGYNKSNFVITGEGSEELMREKTTDDYLADLLDGGFTE